MRSEAKKKNYDIEKESEIRWVKKPPWTSKHTTDRMDLIKTSGMKRRKRQTENK